MFCFKSFLSGIDDVILHTQHEVRYSLSRAKDKISEGLKFSSSKYIHCIVSIGEDTVAVEHLVNIAVLKKKCAQNFV